MLIRTLKELHNKGNKMYLLLPGPDHSKGEYQKLAEKLNLKDYVKFLGWRSDIGQLMATSDLYVASSIREGFGINIVEAQYCHLPVVAVKNRGHEAIIKDGENGFLVPLNNSKMMAERILEIFKDQSLYNRLSNINVDQYECKNIAKVIYTYLQEVMQK